MLYVKLPRGGGKWTIIEAEQVDTDSLWYQIPVPPQPTDAEVRGLDVASELRKRDVELRANVTVLDVSGLFATGEAWHDDCVKVVHVLNGDDWMSYIFQRDGYVMADNGRTLDKL